MQRQQGWNPLSSALIVFKDFQGCWKKKRNVRNQKQIYIPTDWKLACRRSLELRTPRPLCQKTFHMWHSSWCKIFWKCQKMRLFFKTVNLLKYVEMRMSLGMSLLRTRAVISSNRMRRFSFFIHMSMEVADLPLFLRYSTTFVMLQSLPLCKRVLHVHSKNCMKVLQIVSSMSARFQNTGGTCPQLELTTFFAKRCKLCTRLRHLICWTQLFRDPWPSRKHRCLLLW